MVNQSGVDRTDSGRIFLCHSSGDKDPVRKLYHRLRADGYAPWLDEQAILPGQDWDQEIAMAVRSSAVVLVCLSQSAANKIGYVQKEIKYALDVAAEQPEGSIFMIPVRLEQCDVPARLRQWHWVDLFKEDGYPRLRKALVRKGLVAQPLAKINAIRELRTLEGHSDTVCGVAVSAEGRLVVSVSDDSTLKVKLKHVDLIANSINQDAREVKTKFSRTFQTFFFPVGDEIRQIVAEWVSHLREGKLWGNDDPLFPATRVAPGATRHFEVFGLERDHWSNASPIRTIFRNAFVTAGLPYFNPHSFRHTLVQLGQAVCKSPEPFKAWSQNLGHESVLTTFLSYGEVAFQRQGEIIRGLATPQQAEQTVASEFLIAFVRSLFRNPEKMNAHVGSNRFRDEQ